MNAKHRDHLAIAIAPDPVLLVEVDLIKSLLGIFRLKEAAALIRQSNM
jgi:hypothetical protein